VIAPVTSSDSIAFSGKAACFWAVPVPTRLKLMSPPATATAATEAKTIVLRIRVSPCRSAAGTGRYVTRIWLRFGVGITKTAPNRGPFCVVIRTSAAAANALDHRLAVVVLLDDDGAATAGIHVNAVTTPISVAIAAAADTNVDAASFAAHALALATAHGGAATLATAFSAPLASISVTMFAAALGGSAAPSLAARSGLAAAGSGLALGRAGAGRCAALRSFGVF